MADVNKCPSCQPTPPADPLELFLPPVRAWFGENLGQPTPAQRDGWPSIAAGRNTLILAPTGSGKTLAAFLACLDALWRQPRHEKHVHVLYVSPLKALNNDIYRNLQLPLSGVIKTAERMGETLPALTVAVRTGDTPAHERQRLARRPPHVLITTPESLNLILTTGARETLRGIRYCIIDEIHALCPNKRGVFLSLLLERLVALNPNGFVRIGLSATQRPLDEVARYLGGVDRPVSIIDAGLRKDLDLRVLSPVERFSSLPEQTIWPSIHRMLLEHIREHRSTIVFGNNRRAVERITTEVNELAGEAEDVARAHHGSIALEVRQQTEEALKEGRLAAVVATASLELGIDMGAVDLVCQVESPGNIARGLQRVGRAGHLVGQKSKGRLIPKTRADLLEQAVLAREMAAGRVEALSVPTNCLDVLAQQVVAMVAVETWDVPELFKLVRRAYPYRDLSAEAFDSVLEMISGRYPAEGFRDLRPRIHWDRVHNRLHALPGSRQLALVNGGTIPDTGQYAAYIDGRDVRIGELDEEFVYERRLGDVFVLGTSAWRVEQIEADRVLVSRAEGAPATMPFWRGERVGRSPDLGEAMGGFLRELGSRLADPAVAAWLETECHLDPDAAHNLRDYVRRQIEVAGHIPTDRTLLVEAFRDQVGDWHLAVLSPFGSRFNFALRLALEGRAAERFGYRPLCAHHDDGILMRFADMDEPPLDLVEGLRAEDVERLILAELADSALFAIRFRQNAARALVMPRQRPDRRAPLWLQRLKAKELLQIARRFPSFPVVVETYRECLRDHLDVPRLHQFLLEVQSGNVEVVRRRAETPSPFAAGLLFNFTAAFMYEYDKVESRGEAATLDRRALEQLLTPGKPLLDPRAVQQVEQRLRGMGYPPRTVEEMAEWLRRLGDLAESELTGAMADFIRELEQAGRACRIALSSVAEPERWVLAEEKPRYLAAFGQIEVEGEAGAKPQAAPAAGETILQRFLETHALVGLADVLQRYPFDPVWAQRTLETWAAAGNLIPVKGDADRNVERWAAPANLTAIQRGTLALLRREILTCPAHQFADFLLRWQYRHPETRQQGPQGLLTAMVRLEALALDAELWEQTLLPSRVQGYQPRWLDDALLGGDWTWTCQGADDRGAGRLAFHRREDLRNCPSPQFVEPEQAGDAEADRVYEHLRLNGASFVVDLSRSVELSPGRARAALWRLVRRGIVSNDRFDVIRRGEPDNGVAEVQPVALRRLAARRIRRPAGQPSEGRWFLIPWGMPETETRAIHQAYQLLERYGIVARELAQLDPSLLPWRVLYEVLSRLELAGEIRRGYFVEGLSGAQFALPDAARMLSELGVSNGRSDPVVLLHSLDPANLYGSGGPFGTPWAGEDDPPFSRRTGNWIALSAGRPILLVESHGKRVTPCRGAGPDEVRQALESLRDLLRTGHGVNLRGKVSVEEWAGRAVTMTEGKDLLEAAGFVRDYQAMTLYATWK